METAPSTMISTARDAAIEVETNLASFCRMVLSSVLDFMMITLLVFLIRFFYTWKSIQIRYLLSMKH